MNRKMIIVVSLCLVLMGVWLLLRAPAWSAKSATRWLIKEMGGSSDTSKYESVLRAYGQSYSLLGGIFLTIGLARLLWPSPMSGLAQK
ncbi:MAG: hypothetical protein ACM3ZQ_11205 [Bacillota bacterium]